MSLEENKVAVRRFVEEVQSQHRLDLVVTCPHKGYHSLS